MPMGAFDLRIRRKPPVIEPHTWTLPAASVPTACHPRLPGASVPGTSVDALNVRPASSDRDPSSTVPAVPLAVQTTTIDGGPPSRGTRAMRGGCSPLTRASPGVAFTRTGATNLSPPSALTER